MTVEPAVPTNSRHQILALSGGGYRGLYTACFLESCEEAFNTTCAEKFDLITGTSIGALLAAGLALGVPGRELKKAMLKHGPLIFPQNPMTFVKRLMVRAPYDTGPVRTAIADVLRDKAKMPLNQLDTPLLIPAVNYTTGGATLYASRGVAGPAAANTSLMDAVLASAAAPTFFPLKKTGTDQFADGGLIANAPDMIALTNRISSGRVQLDDIYMLSIGTAGRRQGAALHSGELNPSVLSWFFHRGLVQSIMAAQEDLSLSQVTALLGNRHLRIDQEPTEKQVAAISSLDKADQLATNTLTSLAKTSFDTHKTARSLRAFF